MDNYELIDIQRSHYAGIRSLINTTWHVDTYIGNRVLLDRSLDMYLRACLMGSSFGRVIQHNGSVIAIILGRANSDSKRYGRYSHIPSLYLDAAAIRLGWGKSKSFIQEYRKVFDAYHELMEGRMDLYDGQVMFLAVAEPYRGLGLGKRLMKALKDYFHEMSVTSVRVFTDTMSSYGFYDSQGFALEDTRDITMDIDSVPTHVTIFMYAYTVGAEAMEPAEALPVAA